VTKRGPRREAKRDAGFVARCVTECRAECARTCDGGYVAPVGATTFSREVEMLLPDRPPRNIRLW
jgi:hypothetical protein